MKTAKDLAQRGSLRDLQVAKEKLNSMTERDPLELFFQKEREIDYNKAQKIEAQLQFVLDCNVGLFHLSEYWCTRAFIEWTVGDLESSVVLLELAQRTKAQPLHPILESIQFILKKVQKEATTLFTNPSESPYKSCHQQLISTIERLQRISLISCVAAQKLTSLYDQLSNFSLPPEEDITIFSKSKEIEHSSKSPYNNITTSRLVDRQMNMEITPRQSVNKKEKRKSLAEEMSAILQQDLAPEPSYIEVTLPKKEIDIKEEPQTDEDDDSNFDHNNSCDVIIEEIKCENIEFDCEDNDISEEDEVIQYNDVKEEQPDSDISDDDDDDMELEIDLSDCSEEEHDLTNNVDDDDDSTETYDSDQSLEIDLSDISDDDDDDEKGQNTGLLLELTDDTTSSPRRFLEITKTPISQSKPRRQSFISPEFLPNPIPISNVIRCDLGEDPMSPNENNEKKTIKNVFLADSSEESDSNTVEKTKQTAHTPGRVNTPLMKKLREKRRSAILQPSPSPYLRGSKPIRVDPNTFHSQMKQQAKTQESIDALALYRRESILYKASVNDMVNDLFGDEELDDDFSHPCHDLLHTPTPPNSPTKSCIPISFEEPTTPMNSRITTAAVPDEFYNILEKNAQKKEAENRKNTDQTRKGSVIVMTPISTTKKEKSIFDSGKKLTNVRRSCRRNVNEVCTPTKADHSRMLEYCNYAYIPNEKIIDCNEPALVLSKTLMDLTIDDDDVIPIKTEKTKKSEKTKKPVKKSVAVTKVKSEQVVQKRPRRQTTRPKF